MTHSHEHETMIPRSTATVGSPQLPVIFLQTVSVLALAVVATYFGYTLYRDWKQSQEPDKFTGLLKSLVDNVGEPKRVEFMVVDADSPNAPTDIA